MLRYRSEWFVGTNEELDQRLVSLAHVSLELVSVQHIEQMHNHIGYKHRWFILCKDNNR